MCQCDLGHPEACDVHADDEDVHYVCPECWHTLPPELIGKIEQGYAELAEHYRKELTWIARLDMPYRDGYRAAREIARKALDACVAPYDDERRPDAAPSAPQHAPVDADQGAAPASKKGRRP